jgi:hypothetical protein
MGRTCSMHERDVKCIQNFDQNTEGKRPLGRPRHGWEDNIRMHIRELG